MKFERKCPNPNCKKQNVCETPLPKKCPKCEKQLSIKYTVHNVVKASCLSCSFIVTTGNRCIYCGKELFPPSDTTLNPSDIHSDVFSHIIAFSPPKEQTNIRLISPGYNARMDQFIDNQEHMRLIKNYNGLEEYWNSHPNKSSKNYYNLCRKNRRIHKCYDFKFIKPRLGGGFICAGKRIRFNLPFSKPASRVYYLDNGKLYLQCENGARFVYDIAQNKLDGITGSNRRDDEWSKIIPITTLENNQVIYEYVPFLHRTPPHSIRCSSSLQTINPENNTEIVSLNYGNEGRNYRHSAGYVVTEDHSKIIVYQRYKPHMLKIVDIKTKKTDKEYTTISHHGDTCIHSMFPLSSSKLFVCDSRTFRLIDIEANTTFNINKGFESDFLAPMCYYKGRIFRLVNGGEIWVVDLNIKKYYHVLTVKRRSSDGNLIKMEEFKDLFVYEGLFYLVHKEFLLPLKISPSATTPEIILNKNEIS